MDRLIIFLATGFGAGYFPKAPGTIGSLWGVLFAFLLYPLPLVVRVVITIVVIVGSCIISSKAEKIFGEKDAQKITIDEIAGQMTAFLFVPYVPLYLLVGFILFRFFDVTKLFPARWAQDNLSGGVGVVMDDVVAGIQAGFVLLGIHYVRFYF
ncbi:phosphatidylglycerophosphatase A [bacterium]|nr:phosphatidylglycerophosphatase A [bacterium]